METTFLRPAERVENEKGRACNALPETVKRDKAEVLLRKDYLESTQADLEGLSRVEPPTLTPLARPQSARKARLRQSYSLNRTESGKYVSEVVRSRDGSSHLIIKANTNSSPKSER